MRALILAVVIGGVCLSGGCGSDAGQTSGNGGSGGDWRKDSGGTGSTINGWGGAAGSDYGGSAGVNGGAGGVSAAGNGGTSNGGSAGAGNPACSGIIAATAATTSGDTSSGSNALSGSCVAAGGKERVYSFTPTSSGTLTVTLTPASSVDLGVYVFTNCANESASELACSDAGGKGAVETATAAVTSGVEVLIAVDAKADAGAFTLALNVK